MRAQTKTLTFLFGGLFSPAPAIPAGWKWLWFANPITYALEGLTMQQLASCRGGAAAGCPQVTVLLPTGPMSLDVSFYVSEYFGMKFEDRWVDIGVLGIFVGIFVLMNLFSVRFISHVSR